MAMNERMKKINEQLSERDKDNSSNNFEHQDECNEDSKKEDMFTQFLRIQKNHLIDLNQNLERYLIILLVFEFNCERYYLTLIESWRIPVGFAMKKLKHQFIKTSISYLSNL